VSEVETQQVEETTDDAPAVEAEAEFEVVLDGEESSPTPARKGGLQTRISKLTRQRREAEEEADRLKRENELLKQSQPITAPKLEDFDYDDDKYNAAVQSYQDSRQRTIAREVATETAQQFNQSQQREEVDQKLEAKARAHYERAGELKVSDYESAEDVVIERLGTTAVSELIGTLDKSAAVLYHLGKNPGTLEEIASLLTENPLRAAMRLGAIESKLVVRPRLSNTPNPDDPLPGGSPGGSDIESQIDKAREKVAAGKMTMDEYRAFKKSLAS